MDKIKDLAAKVKGNTGSSTGNPPPGDANAGAAGANQKGDFLDQGVGMAGKQFGHNLDRQQEEKYSDYARQGYTKATGSDIPIKDQNPQ